METRTAFVQLPYSTVLIRNIGTVQNFVKNSLQNTRKEMEGGISFFKNEIAGKMNKTVNCLSQLVLPINNFIKDFATIDKEFETERNKNSEFCICLDGKMVPASEISKMDMEENY